MSHHLTVSRMVALVGVIAAIFSGTTALAGMPRREPPLLLGGARPHAEPKILNDPRLPTGARIEAAERPHGPPSVCSFRLPLCVHPAGQDQTREAVSALSALELAYERLVFALGLPPPRSDQGRGGSDAFDAYLGDARSALEVETDSLDSGPFTVAAGFCRLPLVDPSLLERNATLCVGEAVALALDASEPPHLRRAFATWLWWAVGQPTSLDCEAIDQVQAHPELAILGRDRSPQSEGAALWFEYLESVRSSSGPAQLSAALFASAVSPSRPFGLEYVNEPDVFDVLLHSLDQEQSRLAALMIDFSVARAFVGDREDGVHLPSLAWAGAFGRVRFDWMLRFSSLPRRVLVSPPLESTGSVLIWLDLDEVGLGAALGVRAEWEAPVTFQWQLVSVGPDGEELGRVDVPYQERGQEVEARLRNLDGARAVLIVGTNLEGVDLSHPFDPDVTPSEPHSATVYLVRM